MRFLTVLLVPLLVLPLVCASAKPDGGDGGESPRRPWRRRPVGRHRVGRSDPAAHVAAFTPEQRPAPARVRPYLRFVPPEPDPPTSEPSGPPASTVRPYLFTTPKEMAAANRARRLARGVPEAPLGLLARVCEGLARLDAPPSGSRLVGAVA